MGLESFKRYQDLNKRDYFPKRIGFGPEVKGGDIIRLNSRVRLAKDFQGIILDDYTEETTLGYNGFLQVFLTHSALERFMEINSCKSFDELFSFMEPYGPDAVVEKFFERDKQGKLCNFLVEKIDSKKLQNGFVECKKGESANVAHVSAAIRHIFAHGHLSPNVNRASPRDIHASCWSISDFLLRFMDAEFTKKIDACYERIRAKEAAKAGMVEKA